MVVSAGASATSKLWFLKRCDLFERLTEDQEQRLESRAGFRRFAKGDLIYFPGEPGRSVLVVASGRVKIKRITPEGKETILAFIDEGEVFGELAVVDDQPRDDYAEASEASEVLSIDRDDMIWLMEHSPKISIGLTRLLGLRRRRIEARLQNILFRSHRERVAALLLELIESHGVEGVEGWVIRLRLSHQDLAGLIGSARETVTLTLGRLQLEGLIKVKRRSITVVDREGLAQAANP